MTTYIFPENALSTQQTYLSTTVRKTNQLNWRQFDVRIHEENNNLARFPPLFNDTQKLQDHVLRTTVYNMVPEYFRQQVQSQGFDLQGKTTKQLITFFETRCEPVYRAKLASKKRAKKTAHKKAQPKRLRGTKVWEERWCTHCKSDTHNTKDCGHLKREKAKQQREAHLKSKNNFFKSKSMSKEEIKDFNAFNATYKKWQTHKRLKEQREQKHEHHNIEETEDGVEVNIEQDDVELMDFDINLEDDEDVDSILASEDEA